MIIVAASVVLALIAGSCWAIWLNHETVKAEQAKFSHLMQANSESRGWPPPKGPKGFTRYAQPQRTQSLTHAPTIKHGVRQ